MRTNRTKAKLQQGKMVFGAVVGFDSPHTVELPDALGFGYVTFDLEHEVFSERAILHSAAPASSPLKSERLPRGDRAFRLFEKRTEQADNSSLSFNGRRLEPAPDLIRK